MIPGLCLGLLGAVSGGGWGRENFGATVLSNRTVLWDVLGQGREKEEGSKCVWASAYPLSRGDFLPLWDVT